MIVLPIVLALTGVVPVEIAVEDRFDVVHHNHHHGDDGRPVVEQVWWEIWRPGESRHAIAGWRLATPGTCQSPIPTRNAATGEWISIWFDGSVLRRIRARSFHQSWTLGRDPELADRDRHPDWRRTRQDLTNPP